MPQNDSEHGVVEAVPGAGAPGATASQCLPPAAAAPAGAAQPAAEDSLGALKSIAEVGSLFVALSFVGGWSFMASYYQSFGLNSSELDFSVPATAAFAVHMLRHSGWPLLLAGALFAGLALFYGKLGAARRTWAGVCIAILIFAVAAAGSLRGRALASEDMFDTSRRLPNVGFVSKAAAQQPDCLAKGTTDCKLLLHAKGAYYFFEPIPGAASASAHGRNIKLYIVLESEISQTQVVRGVE